MFYDVRIIFCLLNLNSNRRQRWYYLLILEFVLDMFFLNVGYWADDCELMHILGVMPILFE